MTIIYFLFNVVLFVPIFLYMIVQCHQHSRGYSVSNYFNGINFFVCTVLWMQKIKRICQSLKRIFTSVVKFACKWLRVFCSLFASTMFIFWLTCIYFMGSPLMCIIVKENMYSGIARINNARFTCETVTHLLFNNTLTC